MLLPKFSKLVAKLSTELSLLSVVKAFTKPVPIDLVASSAPLRNTSILPAYVSSLAAD